MPLIGAPTGDMNAVGLVNSAWNYYRDLGNSWIEQASEAIGDLSDVQVTPLNFTVTYNPESFFPTFVRPDSPTAPTFGTISVDTPGVPTLNPITLQDLGDAPVAPDLSSVLYQPPSPPTQAAPTPPSDATATLDEIVLPTRPTYTVPELPTLYTLTLPEFPVITIPTFDGVRPSLDLSADIPDNGQLDFVATAYVPVLQPEMIERLQSMIQGEYGLPLAIEQALFDRARAREDRLSRKQVMEVTEDMAARNLTEPNGILAARLRETHADNREKVSALNRDLAIERAKEALEGVKFAIGQGMALEQMLIQQNLAENERALKVAMYVRDFAINRLNALIALANLEQQAYATDAQVWQQRIAGELSKLEVLKAQIDAQRLIGDINKDLLAQYELQWRGVQAMADVYRTEVEAAKVTSSINGDRIANAKLIIEKYSVEVDAWGKLYDAHKTQVEAALGTARFAEVLSNIFATDMQGYKTKGDAYFQSAQTQIAVNGQALDAFRAQLAAAGFDLQAQTATLDGQVRGYAAQVDSYRADGDIAQAESSAMDRITTLKLDSERTRTQTLLQSAQMSIDQAMKIGEILVEQLKAKAAALSQLAAASQSGVNFGASMSDSFGRSIGVNSSLSWTGEAPDTGISSFVW